MKKTSFGYKQLMTSAMLNERFADIAGGSILNGFRLAKGTGNYTISLRRGNDKPSALITNDGVRLMETTDVVDAVVIKPNTGVLNRYDVLYVAWRQDVGGEITFDYTVVEGLPGQPVNIETNPSNRLAIGQVLVRPNVALSVDDLTSFDIGVKFGTLYANGVLVNGTPILTKSYVDQEVQKNKERIVSTESELAAARKTYQTLDERLVGELGQKANILDVEQKFNLIGNASPKGVYATIAALQAAKPTGDTNIYVVVEDGKWYFWNASTWTAGGQYQSNGIEDRSITAEKLSFPVVQGNASKNLFDKNNVKIGFYINGDHGGNFELADFFVSSFLKVKASTFYSYQPKAVYGRIAFYDINKIFISYIDNTATFQSPSNAFYAKVSQNVVNLNILQLEEGTIPTSYEPFGAKVEPKLIPDQSITEQKLAFPLVKGVQGKNLFNKDDVTNNRFISSDDGSIFSIDDYFVSPMIPVSSNTLYSYQPKAAYGRVAFYSETQQFISYLDDTISFKTPSNAKFVRLSQNIRDLNITQLEQGVMTSFETFGVKILQEDVVFEEGFGSNRKLLFTFNDAWVAWKKNEKFPIAFFGDSTTDGWNTTDWSLNVLGSDHQPINAYPFRLQSLLKSAAGKTMLRVYNAGFSGQTAQWASKNIESIFGVGTPYADVKMVGISFGINDRVLYTESQQYRIGFKNDVKSIIDWLYKKGIQPFLLTTQATVETSPSSETVDAYPLRDTQNISTIANEVKKELAEEFNLKLIDLNRYTEKFMENSSYSLQTIIGDKLHFGDVGHDYEAGLLFSNIVPNTIVITGEKRLDLSNQKVKSAIPSDLTTFSTNDPDGFKIVSNYQKNGTENLKIAEYWVFVDTNRKLNLFGYKSDVSSSTYLKIDGVEIGLDTLTKKITELEIGLHHLEVFTGLSQKVDFKGLKLN